MTALETPQVNQRFELTDCRECCGEGSIEIHRPFADDPYYCAVLKCEACNGAGEFINEYELEE